MIEDVNNKQMNILLISYIFGPSNNIAAVRWTKLSKFLKLYGDYRITVLTKKNPPYLTDEILSSDIKYVDSIIEIHTGALMKVAYWVKDKVLSYRKPSKNLGKEVSTKNEYDGLLWKINYATSIVEGWFFYLHSKMYLVKTGNKTDYDIIISTYGPFGGHCIGAYAKRKWPKAKWIADFRDPVVRKNLTPQFFIGFGKKHVEKIESEADLCLAVSKGGLEALRLKSHNKGKIITNGYDRLDFCEIVGTKKTDRFVMTYTGRLYKGKSDLTMLFVALDNLARKGKVNLDKICIQYAGKDFDEIYRQSKKFNLQDVLVNHGHIIRRESLELQRSGNLVLLASWNNPNETGIITGKVYEYMASQKPIVCIVTGSVENCILKEMISAGNLGICCEEATYERDLYELENFLCDQYSSVMNQGFEIYNPNHEYIEKFDYKHIAENLVKLIKEIQ